MDPFPQAPHPDPLPMGEGGRLLGDPRLRDAVLRCDFGSFIAKAFHTVDPGTRYLHNWHIDALAEYLEACRAGEIRRLIINLPPRALKSVCVSVAWPAWLLGHDPSTRVMAASYAQALSLKHSLDCRLVMGAAWYRQLFPELHLARDQNEKSKFVTTQRGYRLATSVGASMIGEGGKFLIVDDPLNPRQAMSPVMRQSANEWFEHSFLTRLDNKKDGCVVVVMQRLHPEDLTGYLLARHPRQWEHLCLPAIAPAREVVARGRVSHVRMPGEALHPGRENIAMLEQVRNELGTLGFAAQYQQNPVPEEGSIVRLEWFRRYRMPPADPVSVVQSWDTAVKAASAHDASVCTTWAEGEQGFYLLDVGVFRLEYPELRRMVVNLSERYKPHVILMEDKASGQSLIQDMRRDTSLPILPQMPKQDKVTRLAAVSAMIEAGRVWLPERAGWLAEFEAEICTFPNAPHDDQVDAMSQFLNWVRQRGMVQARMRRL